MRRHSEAKWFRQHRSAATSRRQGWWKGHPVQQRWGNFRRRVLLPARPGYICKDQEEVQRRPSCVDQIRPRRIHLHDKPTPLSDGEDSAGEACWISEQARAYYASGVSSHRAGQSAGLWNSLPTLAYLHDARRTIRLLLVDARQYGGCYRGNSSGHRSAVVGGSETKIVAAIADFMHRLLAIHPFIDGNGRVARDLASIQARDLLGLNEDLLIEKGPPYYLALRQADKGDPSALEYLLRNAIQGAA